MTNDINDSKMISMAQLIVRNLESDVVVRLRKRAASHGVSMEEEHRQLLRTVLLPKGKRKGLSFKSHLCALPDVFDDNLLRRRRSGPRRTEW